MSEYKLVQGEPVEYQCHSCRKTTPPPAPFKAHVECGECGALTAAPVAVRLAVPQPAPDVARLIVLLEHAQCPNCDGSGARYDNYGEPEQCQWCHERDEALAPYRKQGGKNDDNC